MLGWAEILLILAAMLLVFGPDKLPEMAKSLGSAMKEFQKATSDAQREAKVLENSLTTMQYSPSTIIRGPGPQPAAVPQIAAAVPAVPANASVAETATETIEQVPEATKPDSSIEEVAKVLGISAEGKSEEDLKREVQEKIQGLEIKVKEE